MKDDDRSRGFAAWSGYTPAVQGDHELVPLNAEELLAEAGRCRREADAYEIRGDMDTAAVLRQGAADFEARAADLAE